MRLQPGDRAVPFSAETIDGKTISLEGFAGKPLLLMFYRYASCPMCNLRLRDFATHYASLHDRGLEVVAFFHSPARNIRRNAGKGHYPFHIVPDPQFKVYRSYGVETSWLRFFLSMLLPSFYIDWIRSMRYGFWGGVDWQMGKMPADFLIGPDGRILKAHYGRDIGNHLALDEVETILIDLASQQADRPARETSVPFHDLPERSYTKGQSVVSFNAPETPLGGRGLSLWERINRDPRYLESKHNLQKRYGLPLPFDIRLDRKSWSEWLNADEKRGQAFMTDVHTLFKKFEVPDKWYSDFIADIAGPSSE